MNERWVLSAAHCFDDELIFRVNVSAGMIKRRKPGKHHQPRLAVRIIQHPRWGGVITMKYDVALLKVRPTQRIMLSRRF